MPTALTASATLLLTRLRSSPGARLGASLEPEHLANPVLPCNTFPVVSQAVFPGYVRASDADRERAVALLRRHYAQGRLTVAELESRSARAYGATWRHELRELVRDLPFELPIDRTRVASHVGRFQRGLFRLHARVYAIFNTVLVSEWAWGGGHFFWPAFSIVPGGALLMWHRRGSHAVSQRLTGRRARRAIRPA